MKKVNRNAFAATHARHTRNFIGNMISMVTLVVIIYFAFS